jgi:hypothetical protein
MKIISGGQTGADRAALDAAIKLKLPYGGWLPRGRKTENGPLPAHYNLEELDSENYRTRTEQNVIAGDGTLIVSFGPLTGGSALTESFSIKHDRPCLILNLALISLDEAVDAVEKWIQRYEIAIMNVAGPRASGEPRIYDAVYKLLLQINWKLINK